MKTTERGDIYQNNKNRITKREQKRTQPGCPEKASNARRIAFFERLGNTARTIITASSEGWRSAFFSASCVADENQPRGRVLDSVAFDAGAVAPGVVASAGDGAGDEEDVDFFANDEKLSSPRPSSSSS